MSRTDHAADRQPRARGRLADALEHDLLGRERRHTILALLAVAALVLATVVGVLVDRLLLAGVHHWTLMFGLETLRFGTILAAPVVVGLSVPYALRNGGPIGATGLALAPTIATAVTRHRVVLSGDVLLGLLVGSVAATLAVVTSARRRADGDGGVALRPDEQELLVASTVVVVAAVAHWRLSAAPSPQTQTWIEPAGTLLAVSLAGLAVGWWTWLHEEPATSSSNREQ